MRIEDLTKFEEECPTIVVFNTYMDIRVPLTKKWKKIIDKREEFRFRGDAGCITWRKATVDEIIEHFKRR